MAATTGESRKTIKVAASTHSRLEEAKPYDSMSFDELIRELLDATEDDAEVRTL